MPPGWDRDIVVGKFERSSANRMWAFRLFRRPQAIYPFLAKQEQTRRGEKCPRLVCISRVSGIFVLLLRFWKPQPCGFDSKQQTNKKPIIVELNHPRRDKIYKRCTQYNLRLLSFVPLLLAWPNRRIPLLVHRPPSQLQGPLTWRQHPPPKTLRCPKSHDVLRPGVMNWRG